jgi:TRAP-type mannitol/chloroaromatic compound transport system permease large subunit
VSGVGLLMFGAALVAVVATGLPVYAVLLAVAAIFAALGVAVGAFDVALLSALPYRIIGLLEHDLLQALPLYALIGALLNRLPLAATLHRAGERLFGRHGAAPELSALAVGALLAPMNGSVGASLHMLSRGIAPELLARGTPPARSAATICVASTLGVVIPPSLVLLLLGDAMMRAHTEAVNVTHAAVRIVNTQDVMRAALLPGLALLILSLALVAWRGRQATGERVPLSRKQGATAIVVALVIAALLSGVATGWLVEAAAMGGVLLWVAATLARQLDLATVRLVLRDTMAITGSLFALLVAATSFSLVLRAFGTDQLIARGLQALAPQPSLLLLAVLAGIAACSFVLDAFEMIFLVIPLVMPPVLMSLNDAAWVAALTLLVLQLGFLLPPVGYAIVMSRALLPSPVGLRALMRVLWPQWLVQTLLIAAVFAFPQTTRWMRPTEAPVMNVSPDDRDADRLMQDAIDAQQREDAPAEDAASAPGH